MFSRPDGETMALSQETNFWGMVYTTRFAVPHLRNSQGRVVVISSGGSWFPMPRSSFYNVSNLGIVYLSPASYCCNYCFCFYFVVIFCLILLCSIIDIHCYERLEHPRPVF